MKFTEQYTIYLYIVRSRKQDKYSDIYKILHNLNKLTKHDIKWLKL